MKRLRGRIAVVTGAASGIGRATAMALGRLGAKLHIADVDESRLQTTARELRSANIETHAHVVDVREAAQVERLADAAYEVHGRVDILVNNAGVGHSSPITQTSLEDWRWVLDVNLWGVVHGVQTFVPRMIAQGGQGHIVNVASLAGLLGVPTMVPYCTSKFAVVGLSESLAAELSPYGIDVTVVCPGLVKTGIVAAARVGGVAAARHDDIVGFYERHGIAPDVVARRIVDAVRHRHPVTLTAVPDKLLLLAGRVVPARWVRTGAAWLQRRVVEGR